MHDVDHVVRDPFAVREARLRGPDVEVTVDLHRVRVDDLAVEPLGERHRHGALPSGGGPGDHDDRGTRTFLDCALHRPGG
jgi:hypothetical protein